MHVIQHSLLWGVGCWSGLVLFSVCTIVVCENHRLCARGACISYRYSTQSSFLNDETGRARYVCVRVRRWRWWWGLGRLRLCLVHPRCELRCEWGSISCMVKVECRGVGRENVRLVFSSSLLLWCVVRMEMWIDCCGGEREERIHPLTGAVSIRRRTTVVFAEFGRCCKAHLAPQPEPPSEIILFSDLRLHTRALAPRSHTTTAGRCCVPCYCISHRW